MATDRERMGLILISILTILEFNLVLSFNVDVDNKFVYSQPDKYFGYSLAYYQTRLYVGAPLSNSSGDGRGAVFYCRLIGNEKKITKVNYVYEVDQSNEIKNGQWMGATVYSDNEKILACAPRYIRLGVLENGVRPKNMQGKCSVINEVSLEKAWKPCEDSIGNVSSRFCQAGFSAKIIDPRTRLLSGFPTVDIDARLDDKNASVGRVALGNPFDSSLVITKGTGISYGGYMGYSTTSGVLQKPADVSGNSLKFVAGGTPRSLELKGRVILYKDQNELPILKNIDDPSNPEQTGSYFGAAMASADINGDGYFDLVVGAPYYSSNIVNEGIAYVYINQKKEDDEFLSKPTQALKQPQTDVRANGMFGYAIGSVGDLNQDNLNDIAVGAPWGGKDGNGAVYVYYGQKNEKEPLKLMQTIQAADAGSDVKGFGFSFAEYYPYGNTNETWNDPDENKYPDLAVGAYLSGHAIVFRSRPVQTVRGELDLGGVQKLDLFDDSNICDVGGTKYKCVKNVKACLQFVNETHEGDATYTLEADSGIEGVKRAFFLDGEDKQVSQITAELNIRKNSKKCSNTTMYIKNTTLDALISNLATKLSYKFKPSSKSICSDKCPGDPTAQCNVTCPIGDKLASDQTVKEIIFLKGCSDDGNDSCSSNLKLSVSAVFEPNLASNVIAAGDTERIIMTIKVENFGENALTNKLFLEYPGKEPTKLVEIVDAKIVTDGFKDVTIWDPDVTRTGDKTTLQVDIAKILKNGKSESVDVTMALNTIPKGTELLMFKAYVETASSDVDKTDNSKEYPIEVDLVSILLASSKSEPEVITWSTEAAKKGREIKYTFLFQNKGPSNVDTSKAVIQIPEKIGNSYFLNIFDIDDKSEGCTFNGELNPLRILSNSTTSRRKRREVEPPPLACDGGTTCRRIECNFKRLEKSKSKTITVRANLVDSTFENVIKDGRTIKAKSEYTTDAVKTPKGTLPAVSEAKTIVNSPHLTKTEDTTVPWWLILLCILAAIIIIAAIVFIMYKKGFFKRKKLAEEDEALHHGDPEDD